MFFFKSCLSAVKPIVDRLGDCLIYLKFQFLRLSFNIFNDV